MKIEMDINDFYAKGGHSLFIDRMSAFLGITTDKLRIVSVVSGSVIVKYEIVLDDETLKSEKIANMTAPTTDVNGTVTTPDPCSGVTSGIATAILDGSLDLGLGDDAKVSKLDYACSKVVENDTVYNTTIAA
jgi:hypothetical protein